MNKRIYLLLAVCLILCSYSVFAQGAYINLTFFGSNSNGVITTCAGSQNAIHTNTLSTGYVANDLAQIDIDWGDGNTASNTVTFIQPGYYSPNYLYHVYAVNGNYSAVFTFTDTYGHTDTGTLQFNVTDNCGVIYPTVSLDVDNDGTGDAPVSNPIFDITGTNGITQTVSLSNHVINSQTLAVISGVDITYSPYTVAINPGWLAAHGSIMSPSNPTTTTAIFSSVLPIDTVSSLVVVCDPNAPTAQTDLAVNYIYGWNFRAGQQTGFLRFNVCNYSCSGTQNSDIDIMFDSLLTVVSHDIPGATVTANTIHANVTIGTCETYTIYFDVPGTAQAGTPLNFQVDLSAVGATDFDLSNNSQPLVSEVFNSWDPNDKSVNKPEIISPAVQDELVYTIRFQNEGNDEAYNIVIKDTLSANLDLSTFALVENSHNVLVTVDPSTRIVTFNFPNIYLAAASVNEPESHGSVTYKIKENAGLPIGSEIFNTAYIYFDANPPIVTNTTHNMNANVSIQEPTADRFSAYPVPATDYLVIASKNNQPIESLRLVDITGKTVWNLANVPSVYTLDMQSIVPGAYNLVIQSQGIMVNKKIMVKK